MVLLAWGWLAVSIRLHHSDWRWDDNSEACCRFWSEDGFKDLMQSVILAH